MDTARELDESNPLMAEVHLAELGAVVERLTLCAGPEMPVVEDTSAGMRVAVTVDNWGCHLSVSHPTFDAAEAARTLGGIDVASANGVFHVRLREPLSSDYFTRRPSG